MAHEEEGALVLFDGVCNLCNASVMFIIGRDPAERFRFASLQSEFGQAQIRYYRLTDAVLESLVLVEYDRCYTRLSAALRIRGLLRSISASRGTGSCGNSRKRRFCSGLSRTSGTPGPSA